MIFFERFFLEFFLGDLKKNPEDGFSPYNKLRPSATATVVLFWLLKVNKLRSFSEVEKWSSFDILGI